MVFMWMSVWGERDKGITAGWRGGGEKRHLEHEEHRRVRIDPHYRLVEEYHTDAAHRKHHARHPSPTLLSIAAVLGTVPRLGRRQKSHPVPLCGPLFHTSQRSACSPPLLLPLVPSPLSALLRPPPAAPPLHPAPATASLEPSLLPSPTCLSAPPLPLSSPATRPRQGGVARLSNSISL